MSTSERENTSTGWAPDWALVLAAPVWVTDADGQLTYINRRAEEMLELTATESVGMPCYRVVRGEDELGTPMCGPLCAVRKRARAGLGIEPVRMRIQRRSGNHRWLQILPISVHPANGPHVVHCVLDETRLHRVEEYLTRITTRSPHPSTMTGARHADLTTREREILGLLAEDETLFEIAARLGVSHATVRNHVQHVLAKLGVHSIVEAVAWYLLDPDD